MREAMKGMGGPVLILILGLFQVTSVLARSDDVIQREIEAQFAESEKLRGTRIEVYVEKRLVILTGEVRLYEQKLIAGRIAWTMLGVFEVGNKIRVVPKLAISDATIERQIREIVKADERFNAANIVVRVNDGIVFLQGDFLDFRDPLMLKHELAEVEGAVDIKISAAFLARLSGNEDGAGVNPRQLN